MASNSHTRARIACLPHIPGVERELFEQGCSQDLTQSDQLVSDKATSSDSSQSQSEGLSQRQLSSTDCTLREVRAPEGQKPQVRFQRKAAPPVQEDRFLSMSMASVRGAIKSVVPSAEVACFCDEPETIIDNLPNLLQVSSEDLCRFKQAESLFLLVEASHDCYVTVEEVLKRYSSCFRFVIVVLMEQPRCGTYQSVCNKMSSLVRHGADDVVALPASMADLSMTISVSLAKGKAHRQVENNLKKKLCAATQQCDELFWLVANDSLPEIPKEHARMPEIPGVRFGDFAFIKTLGQGNFGTVHACKALESGDSCAVKVFPKVEIKSHGQLQKIVAEYSVLTKIRHENVVSGLRFLHGFKNLYIVMEMAGPISLFKMMTAAGERGLPWHKGKSFLLQIAAGLSSLHANHIAHCDLKPENIVTSEDGCLKLVDFGEAIDVTKEIPKLRFPRGTMPFMAPEVMRLSPEWDPVAGDVWQVGVILVEMVCGNHSFARFMGWRGMDLAAIPLQQRVEELAVSFGESAKVKTLEEIFKRCTSQPSFSVTEVLTDMLELAPERRLPMRLVARRLDQNLRSDCL